MAEYRFQNAAGETRYFSFPMSEAPPIGSKLRREGKTWRRVIEPVAPGVKIQGDRRFTSTAAPLHWGQTQDEQGNWHGGYAPRYDAMGRAQFTSHAEIEDAMARARHDGELVAYDDMPR